MYSSPFPSDADESRGASGQRLFRIALSGVAGVVLGAVVGLSAYTSTPSITSPESTTFIGLTASRPPVRAAPLQINGMGMSVQAMQNTLKMYGVPPSPIQKLALTQLAATRDPSMKAQVMEEFSNLEPAVQAKVQKNE